MSKPQPFGHKEAQVDAVLSGGGSLYLLQPVTGRAYDWITENTTEEVSWYAGALVMEHRFMQHVIDGMERDGLTVKLDVRDSWQKQREKAALESMEERW